MGQHSVPRGERSSYNQANGSPGSLGRTFLGNHRKDGTSSVNPQAKPQSVLRRLAGYIKKN